MGDCVQECAHIQMEAMTVDDVRLLAWLSSQIWNEIYHEAYRSVFAFDDPELEAHLDVNYRSGTVASTLQLPTRGLIKHMRFRVGLAELRDRFETGMKYLD